MEVFIALGGLGGVVAVAGFLHRLWVEHRMGLRLSWDDDGAGGVQVAPTNHGKKDVRILKAQLAVRGLRSGKRPKLQSIIRHGVVLPAARSGSSGQCRLEWSAAQLIRWLGVGGPCRLRARVLTDRSRRWFVCRGEWQRADTNPETWSYLSVDGRRIVVDLWASVFKREAACPERSTCLDVTVWIELTVPWEAQLRRLAIDPYCFDFLITYADRRPSAPTTDWEAKVVHVGSQIPRPQPRAEGPTWVPVDGAGDLRDEVALTADEMVQVYLREMLVSERLSGAPQRPFELRANMKLRWLGAVDDLVILCTVPVTSGSIENPAILPAAASQG